MEHEDDELDDKPDDELDDEPDDARHDARHDWAAMPAWWRAERAPLRAAPVARDAEGTWRTILFGLLATRALHAEDIDVLHTTTLDNLLRRAGYPLRPVPVEPEDLRSLRVLRDGLALALLDRARGRDALNHLMRQFSLVPVLPDDMADDEVPDVWLVSADESFLAGLAEPFCSLVLRWHLNGAVQRAGTCAVRLCGVPFLNEGRRNDRRYCSPRCAARERKARSRAAG